VVLAQALRSRLLAAVAIVLLVNAVKLEQLLRFVAESRRVLDQLLFDEPTKVVAGRLDGLVLRQSFERCAVGQIRQTD